MARNIDILKKEIKVWKQQYPNYKGHNIDQIKIELASAQTHVMNNQSDYFGWPQVGGAVDESIGNLFNGTRDTLGATATTDIAPACLSE